MRTIIAGSRQITDPCIVEDAIRLSGFDISEVVSGRCRVNVEGHPEIKTVDEIGEDWAALNDLPIKLFPAQWRTHGKAAGPIRNREMALYADALVAVWDGRSRGTKSMIDLAYQHGLKVYVHKPK